MLAAERVLDRMRLTMSVMMAVRRHLMAAQRSTAAPTRRQAAVRPPPFVVRPRRTCTDGSPACSSPHRDELAVAPAVAAVALRSLIFGASRPSSGWRRAHPAEIADLLLDGVRRREVRC